jgi:cell wall-associated NlpC family hydrolase
MTQFMADKGLFKRLDEVRHNVTDRASDLVVTAMGFLGVPYRRGGNSVETGFDCSGFVKAMYEQTIGLVLPRRANEQAAATQTIDKKDLQPGDLVFFNTMRRAFSHVGIYVGNGKFIHSPKPGAEVRVEDMGVSYWARRFDGARRVSTDAPDNQTAAR